MARPGVMFYFDVRPCLKRLTDEDKGRLFEAILDFGEFGVIPDFDGALGVAWDFIQPRIERDSKRYESIVEKRTQAAKARWAKEGQPVSDANECTCIEDNLWHEQLRKALEDVLNEIPEKYGDVVRMRFFEGKTLDTISQEQNVTRERVRQLEHKGIKEMRRPQNKNRLKPFIEFDYFGGTGLTTFRQTGMSVQERYLVRKEKSTDQR